MAKTLIEQMIEQNGGSSVFRDPMPGSARMIDLNAPIPRFLVGVDLATGTDVQIITKWEDGKIVGWEAE